jgi:hypothetical protein
MQIKGKHARDDESSSREVAMPATVMSITPVEGADGTEIAIEGGGFQAQGPTSKVTIGYADAAVMTWDDAQIVASAARGINVLDAPIAVMIHTDDGQDTIAGSFTFRAGAVVAPPTDSRTISLDLTNSGDAAIGLFHLVIGPDGIMQESLTSTIQPKGSLTVKALPGAVRFKVL